MEEKTKLAVVGIIVILACNLLLMSRSFYATHAIGDERVYVGVAMKLDRHGFEEYNLKRIDLVPKNGFLEYAYSADPKGNLLDRYESVGTPFYNQPLFHAPPLFPYLLNFSHGLFASGLPYTVLSTDFKSIKDIGNSEKFAAQFYCTIVPIASGILLVLCCFFLGKVIFSTAIGFITAILITISPIHLLSSQRIWADTPLALLVACAMLFSYIYATRGSSIALVLSAISFAAALLTKNSTVIAIAPILYCYLHRGKAAGATFRSYLGFLAFTLLVILLTLPWYRAVVGAYGTPFFNPSQGGISETHSWFALINSRPWYTYLVGIPYQVPLYLLGYFSIAALLFNRVRGEGEVLLSVWFLSYLIIVSYYTHRNEMLGPDHRYMLPAYPALAILSAGCLNRVRVYLNRKSNPIVGNGLTVLLVAACVIWSLSIAFKYLDNVLIPVPF